MPSVRLYASHLPLGTPWHITTAKKQQLEVNEKLVGNITRQYSLLIISMLLATNTQLSLRCIEYMLLHVELQQLCNGNSARTSCKGQSKRFTVVPAICYPRPRSDSKLCQASRKGRVQGTRGHRGQTDSRSATGRNSPKLSSSGIFTVWQFRPQRR